MVYLASLLKYVGMSITPSLMSMFKQSAETCKPPDQWKIAKVSASFKKGREEDRHVTDHCLCSVYQGKLMESCIASYITNHVVTQNLHDNR